MPLNGSPSLMSMEEARGWLAAAVATKGPEFVYRDPKWEVQGDNRACSYFPRTDLPEGDPRKDTPCLIGVAMRLAGREVTYAHECRTPDSLSLMRAWNLSPEAAMYLRWAQSKQDVGHTWGEALAFAENEANARREYLAKWPHAYART